MFLVSAPLKCFFSVSHVHILTFGDHEKRTALDQFNAQVALSLSKSPIAICQPLNYCPIESVLAASFLGGKIITSDRTITHKELICRALRGFRFLFSWPSRGCSVKGYLVLLTTCHCNISNIDKIRTSDNSIGA